jgi:hypothetical protein
MPVKETLWIGREGNYSYLMAWLAFRPPKRCRNPWLLAFNFSVIGEGEGRSEVRVVVVEGVGEGVGEGLGEGVGCGKTGSFGLWYGCEL